MVLLVLLPFSCDILSGYLFLYFDCFISRYHNRLRLMNIFLIDAFRVHVYVSITPEYIIHTMINADDTPLCYECLTSYLAI